MEMTYFKYESTSKEAGAALYFSKFTMKLLSEQKWEEAFKSQKDFSHRSGWIVLGGCTLLSPLDAEYSSVYPIAIELDQVTDFGQWRISRDDTRSLQKCLYS